MASEYDEWKATLEKECIEIVKTKLPEKHAFLIAEWERFRQSPSYTASTGQVNPIVPTDKPNAAAFEFDTPNGLTGMNNHVKMTDAHAETIPSRDVTIFEFAVAQARECHDMVSSLRLHLINVAPPKRSADDLETSVQKDIVGQMEIAINWCKQCVASAGPLNMKRATWSHYIRGGAPSKDADQYMYEQEQLVTFSCSQLFSELLWMMTFLRDIIEVRLTIYSIPSILRSPRRINPAGVT